jgi:hypothetical protein
MRPQRHVLGAVNFTGIWIPESSVAILAASRLHPKASRNNVLSFDKNVLLFATVVRMHIGVQ